MGNKYIYVLLSRTSTTVAKTIRTFTKNRYSHVAISFDEELTQCYAFARVHYKVAMLGQLVKESYTSYTLNKRAPVPVKLYKIPVSENQYNDLYKIVREIWEDPEYIYNLLSVIMFPFSKGIDTYKSYTCIQFVMMILKTIGFDLKKPLHKYIPDDLLEILKDYEVYDGDIRGIMSDKNVDVHFMEAVPFKEHLEVVRRLYVLCKRSIKNPVKEEV